jgi:hypothetical protein
MGKFRMFGAGMVALVATLALTAGHAAEPSSGCNGGQVPPGTTPAGIGVSGVAPPGTPPSGAGSLKVCSNTGTVVPAKGAVTVSGNTAGSGYVEVDGDSNNTTPANCGDVFVRVSADQSGPKFYESKDGSYADTKPAQAGNQQAQPEGPDAWLQNLAANCAPPPPA